jgi:3-hydroxybutyryl-CoA dehydrogenase
MTNSITRVAVVGAGRMGHGIALTFALNGLSVSIYDVDRAVLEESVDRIEDALATLAEAGRISDERARLALENVSPVAEFGDCVESAQLVTEAVAEDLDVKQMVFEQLEDHATADAVLATNTSGLSIGEITAAVTDRTRVLGTHWFNPPYIVPLVEIVKGPSTSQEVVDSVYDLLESAAKTPVVVEKEIPGFIGNRIQAAMSYEALSLLERGVATPADIDRAVKAGFGYRLPILGIFEKMDQSGLDIHHKVEQQLMGDLDRGTDPSTPLSELVERGETGTDTGKGIYDWTDVDVEDVQRTRDRALLALYDPYRDALVGASPSANYDKT